MLIEELQQAMEDLFPNGFAIETDRYGQIVIFTGLKYDDTDPEELVAFDAEEGGDIDPDLEELDGELDDDD